MVTPIYTNRIQPEQRQLIKQLFETEKNRLLGAATDHIREQYPVLIANLEWHQIPICQLLGRGNDKSVDYIFASRVQGPSTWDATAFSVGDRAEQIIGFQTIFMQQLNEYQRQVCLLNLTDDQIRTIFNWTHCEGRKPMVKEDLFSPECRIRIRQFIFAVFWHGFGPRDSDGHGTKMMLFFSKELRNGQITIFDKDAIFDSFALPTKVEEAVVDETIKLDFEDQTWQPTNPQCKLLNSYYDKKAFLTALIVNKDTIFKSPLLDQFLQLMQAKLPEFSSVKVISDQDLNRMEALITNNFLQVIFRYLLSSQQTLFNGFWKVPPVPEREQLEDYYIWLINQLPLNILFNLTEQEMTNWIKKKESKKIIQAFFQWLLKHKVVLEKKVDLKETIRALSLPGKTLDFCTKDKFFTNYSLIQFLSDRPQQEHPATLPKLAQEMFSILDGTNMEEDVEYIEIESIGFSLNKLLEDDQIVKIVPDQETRKNICSQLLEEGVEGAEDLIEYSKVVEEIIAEHVKGRLKVSKIVARISQLVKEATDTMDEETKK